MDYSIKAVRTGADRKPTAPGSNERQEGLSLAPLGPLSETPATASTVSIDTSHLSLVTDEG
jgi:hypothetical protein